VENMLAEVVGMCREAVGEVFAEKGEEAGGLAKEKVKGSEYRPIGGDAVLADSIEAAGRQKIAPHIGAFEKLSLLGA